MPNKKIRNATGCSSNNITFKSQLEKAIYNTLIEQGFTPKYEFMTYELWGSTTSVTPFYDKETDKQQTKRVEEGSAIKSKILVEKSSRIIGIRYTPDFYIRYKDLDIYIEAKGIENDVFYIKKKLFRKYLDDKFFKTKQHSIFFEVYTKRQLLQAIDIFKQYEQTLNDEKETK